MTDLLITPDDARAVAHVEGITDLGVDFIDAYSGPMLDAIDSGRISVPLEAVADLQAAAREQGLGIAEGGDDE